MNNLFFVFQLKAVQLNNELKIVATAEVQFDTDLPEFRTTGGVNAGPKKNEYEKPSMVIFYNFYLIYQCYFCSDISFNLLCG